MWLLNGIRSEILMKGLITCDIEEGYVFIYGCISGIDTGKKRIKTTVNSGNTGVKN